MRGRPFYALTGLAALGAAAAWLGAAQPPALQAPAAAVSRPIELAPMCPWRRPEADLEAFFPGSSGHRTEVRILSGARLALAQRLGRMPGPEENALYIHRIDRGAQPHPRSAWVPGAVLTRRVKGEYGAIEIVVAVSRDGTVRGVRLQRQREPAPIAGALLAPRWLQAFQGKTAAGEWHLGRDIPPVPAEARASARAVIEGVRSLLILLETAEQQGIAAEAPHHH